MRTGIFGGTFDPPHHGHLALCRAAFYSLPLDRLLWVLTPNPPHKRGQRISLLRHRLAMVQVALQETPFELSRVDIDRPAPHYALDTVTLLAGENPGAELIYLMGGDSLTDLPTWHRASELVTALDEIGVLQRPGEHTDLAALERLLPGVQAKVRFLEAAQIDISASEVRRSVRAREPFEHLVPAGVAAYIHTHRLYHPPHPKP